jgi:hypothetical protein
MSELQDEIVKLLGEHENGLSVERIQSLLQERSLLKVPQWLITFELDSLRVEGLTTRIGFVWCLRK